NTLWNGVCGEEGPLGVTVQGGYRFLQEFLAAEQSAGMMLSLCSKNSEEDVKAVFAQNSGMVLRREHIVSSQINWAAKSQNLLKIARDLQLSLDSFIFIDDNPLECEDVRQNCPEVLTIELPRDSDEFPQLLKHVWAFDRVRTSGEDKSRTALYQNNLR